MMKFELVPIAFVQNPRSVIEDDNWAEVISDIVLEESIPTEALNGIAEFSHLEIVFYMDQVKNEKAIAQCRHPRNNLNLPKLGTYAQRNKNRPNKLGLTTVELIERKGRKLKVKYLDAINGTPVLDIKPVMEEFQAQTAIKQPDWTRAIMKYYWKK